MTTSETAMDGADRRPRRIEVAAGVIIRSGRMLITRRPEGAHLAGLWEFPGGKREPGETWQACLQRELLEELGVEAAVGDLFDEVVFDYPEKSVHLRFYLAEVTTGDPQPLGCAEVRWIGREDVSAHAFPPADQMLLERLCSSEGLWKQGES